MMYFRHRRRFTQNPNMRLAPGPKEIEGESAKNLQLFPRGREGRDVQVQEMSPMGLLGMESVGFRHGNAGYSPDAGR
jgi:hypothetical protein